MTPTTLRRLVGSLVVAGGLVGGALVAAPAQADSLTLSDPAGDAVRMVFDASGDDQEPVAAPNARVVDIVRTRIDYRQQRLVVRTAARAASKGVDRVYVLKAGGRESYFFATGNRVISAQAPCPGARASVNKATRTYSVVVPARCFDAPSAVRVGTGAVRSDFDVDSETGFVVVDDALRDGFDGEDLRLSPGVARG